MIDGDCRVRRAAIALAVLLLAMGTATAGQDFLEDYMRRYLAAIEPDEHHERLTRLAGEWSRRYRYLLNPEADSSATLTRSVIHDGRFLIEEERGEFQGSPAVGTAVLGFNRATDVYERVEWHDMTTGITFATGEASADGSELTFAWRFREPVLETWIRARLVWRFVGPDRIEQTLYEADDEADLEDPASWRRTMEIVDVRVR